MLLFYVQIYDIKFKYFDCCRQSSPSRCITVNITGNLYIYIICFSYLKYLKWYIIVLHLSVRCMYIYYLLKTGIFWQWTIWMLLLNFYSFCSSSSKLNICSLLICLHMWCIHIYFIKNKTYFNKGYVSQLGGLAGRWWCDALMFTRSFYPIYHIQYTLKDVFCIKLNKI